MKIQIVVLALALGLAMGCATRIDGSGLSVVMGNSSIAADCDAGESIQCEDVIKGGSLSAGFLGLASQVVKTVVSVASKFVPGGLDKAEPDTLRVELVEK